MEYYTVVLKKKWGCKSKSDLSDFMSDDLEDGDTSLDLDVRRCRSAHFIYGFAEYLASFFATSFGEAVFKSLKSSIISASLKKYLVRWMISFVISAGISLTIGGIDFSDVFTVPFFTLVFNELIMQLALLPASILTAPLANNVKLNLPKAKDDLICAMAMGSTKNLQAIMVSHGMWKEAALFADKVLFFPSLMKVLDKKPTWIPGFDLALEKMTSSVCCGGN